MLTAFPFSPYLEEAKSYGVNCYSKAEIDPPRLVAIAEEIIA